MKRGTPCTYKVSNWLTVAEAMRGKLTSKSGTFLEFTDEQEKFCKMLNSDGKIEVALTSGVKAIQGVAP